MIIKKADKLGFCYGVKNAVDKSIEYGKKNKNVYTLGELIHNKRAIEYLNKYNVYYKNALSEITNKDKIIIRSHGEPKKIYEYLFSNNIEFIDCTCPHVKKIHDIVCNDSNKGNKIIILGNKNHPEIIGIAGWVSSEITPIFIDESNYLELKIDEKHNYSMVVQTTFDTNLYFEIKKNLKSRFNNILFYDTICYATKQRQEAIENLSKEVDLMIVVGGKNSSNTKKLATISDKYCKTLLIEDAKDLVFEELKNYEKIGVSAGASTPDFVIDEVLNFVLTQNNFKELDLMSSEMEKLLMEEEQNYQEVYKGSRVKGIVERIKPDSYYITLNYKTDGILPKSETNGENDINIGDELDLEVVKIDKNTGEIILSKKRLDEFKAWDDLQVGTVINVSVVDKNEKGLITRYKNSIRGFIPLSHVESRFVNENVLDGYINQSIDVEVIDVDQKKRRLILSRKNILTKEIEAAKAELLNKIEVNGIYKGTIKAVKDYGLFVDLGGLTGLVHVSELSWVRKDNLASMYKINDEIDVQVLEFDKENQKLSLSVKSMMPNPWDVFVENNSVGSEIEGTVKNIKEYGIFVTLSEGIDGFVHISNISSSFVKNPQEVVKIGDVVSTKILSIDPETKKIELTMNLTEEDNSVEDTEEVSE